MLWEEIALGSERGIKVNQIIAAGKFVPTSIILELLDIAMENACKDLTCSVDKLNFFIDGFPRNTENYEMFNSYFGDKAVVKAVLYLIADEEIMI